MNASLRIFKNFFSVAFGLFAGGLLYLATLTYLARILGPHDFGSVSFAETFLMYFVVLANLGLDLFGIRAIARDKDRTKDLARRINALRLIAAFVAFAAMGLCGAFLNVTPEIKWLIILFGLALFPLSFSLEWVFQGLERMEMHGAFFIVRELFLVASVFLFIRGSGNLFLVPLLYCLSRFVAVLVLAIIFSRRFGYPFPAIDVSFGRQALPESIPMGLSQLMGVVIYNLGITAVGILRTSEEVGFYTVALRPIILLLLLAGAYSIAIFPVFSNKYKSSLTLFKQSISTSTRIVGIAAFFVVAGGVCLAKPLILLIYGPAYAQSVPIFQLLLFGLGFAIVNTVYTRALLASDAQNAYLLIVSLQAFFCLAGCLLLVPGYGVWGAAITTTLAELAGFFGYTLAFRRIIRLRTRLISP